MKTNMLRGGLLAAVSIFALGYGLMPTLTVEQAAAQSAKPAVLTSKGAWSAAATYAVDDVVTLRGTTWRSKVAGNKNHLPGSTNPNNASFWEALAVGFNPRGNWSNATTYQPNELVQYQGQTWRAKATNINATPAANANWELLVTKGAAGPNTGIAAGSQSVPSISFNGDPNTGIFSPSADKIAIVEGGELFLHNMGSANIALGFQSLKANTNGDSNSALGFQSLMANTVGHNNTAVGRGTLLANTEGVYNTAIGSLALNQLVNAAINTAVGFAALYENNNSSFNTAVGGYALHKTKGGNNTAIGAYALGTNTAGISNVAIGYNALALTTTTSNNIAIGAEAGVNPTAAANSIFIGNGGALNDTAVIKIGTIGAPDIQTTFIAGIKDVGLGSGMAVYIDTTTGQLGTQGASSARYKEEIRSMEDVTAILNSLRPVTFRYKQAEKDGNKPLHYGLIAEEVAEVQPYLAVFNADGTLRTVHYDRLPTFLLAGWQAQQKTIAAQAEELRAQTEINASLEARLARLEAALPRVTKAALQ